jgi:nitrite transporter NirC
VLFRHIPTSTPTALVDVAAKRRSLIEGAAMPIAIPQALDEAAAVAATKVRQARRVPRYLLLSAYAGAFVGVAVVLLVSVSAPLAAAESPITRLVQGVVFGIALTLVVFAGAELFTGNAMTLVHGLYARSVTMRDLAVVWGLSLVGNLVGSVAFAGLVHGGGTLGSGGATLVASIVDTKSAATGPQLFWRAVLCNLLVCVALWMAQRAQSDSAKLITLWWGLLAFIASGFEHSVANMTVFSLGVFQGSATWLELARNLAWTVPGNVVGGGLLMGLAYAWLGGPRPAVEPADAPQPAPEPVAALVGDGVAPAVESA